MGSLRIINGEVITSDAVEVQDLFIDGSLIDFIPHPDDKIYTQTIDARNCYVSAGLFDLQVNGSQECDLWADPNTEQFAQLCTFMLKAGVTAFLPTLITADIKHLLKNIHFLESIGVGEANSPALNHAIHELLNITSSPGNLIHLPGIHLEGPYLSAQRAGVHPPQYIKAIEMTEFRQLMRPPVKLVTLAPELDSASSAISYLLEHKITPSLGHSNATFNQAKQAFASGIAMVTHIFNALPPIQQRQPGAVVAALLNENVYCCVICDGLHVDPEMVRLLVKIKGKDRVILVTDIAHIGTTSGGLVGSSIKLSQAIANIVDWGIVTFPQAIQMATLNPAKAMHVDQSIGQIKKGRRADLVIWHKDSLKIKHVIANGINVF